MKTMLHAGMLSLLFSCAFCAQSAVSQNPSLKSTSATPGASVSDSLKNSNSQSIEKIDLNKADVNDLAHSVKGIGQKRAQAIVKYRQNQGNFKALADLANVPGLGRNFVKNHNAELEQTFKVN